MPASFSVLTVYPYIVGAAISALLLYFFNLSKDQRDRAKKAKDAIHQAFVETLAQLEDPRLKVINILDEECFRQHNQTIQHNLYFLLGWNRWRLRKAWKNAGIW